VSDHCDGRVFFNTPTHINRTWLEVLRWKRAAKPVPWPKWVQVEQQTPAPAPGGGAVALTWINHATFLLQGEFGAVLTDPHFSHRAGPLGLLGPGRVHAPGVAFEQLPHIDTVLLSHDHYDHCDLASLRRLAKRDDPLVVTPLGNGALVRRAGLRRVVELDWWEEAPELAGGLRVTCTPARHWSNRLRGARNGRLWGGFYLSTPARRVYFSGDTGYHESLFSSIRSRLGSPDLAMLPIGAYEPRWFMQPQHCSPEEAVRIHCEVGAARSVAMHWGCWQLADEGREEAPELLARELARCGLGQEAFRALKPGESLVF
jgi:L-ascorbate metabolism protein UlaG (beta-lactamase superfamily)